MGWGVVLLLDVARRQAGWKAALGAGLLFGAAATMRQEAYVYGAVAAATACLSLLVRYRLLLAAVGAAVAIVVGRGVCLLANQSLERAALGPSLRAERAT